MWTIVRTGLLGLGLMACTRAVAREPEHHDASQALESRALDRILVAGTLIEATIVPGKTLAAIVSADVTNARRWVVIPAGSPVGLRITHRGLDITSMTVRGRLYPVRATAESTPVAAPGTRILFVLAQSFAAASHH